MSTRRKGGPRRETAEGAVEVAVAEAEAEAVIVKGEGERVVGSWEGWGRAMGTGAAGTGRQIS